MTTYLRTALAEYLKLRRGLGFGLRRDEKLLVQFLDHLDELGRTAFSVDDALAWAELPAPASAGWLGMRLSVVQLRRLPAHSGCGSSGSFFRTSVRPWTSSRALPLLRR